MGEKKYRWHLVLLSEAEIDSQENGIATLEVSGKKICITRWQDGWYAFAAKCPHAGGLLSEGYIDAAGNVVCPLHRYKFNLTNGRNGSGEGYFLKTYPVEIRAAGLFVGLEEGGLFNWL